MSPLATITCAANANNNSPAAPATTASADGAVPACAQCAAAAAAARPPTHRLTRCGCALPPADAARYNVLLAAAAAAERRFMVTGGGDGDGGGGDSGAAAAEALSLYLQCLEVCDAEPRLQHRIARLAARLGML
jgi:hypothetical protein